METKETNPVEPVLQVLSKENDKINVFKIHPKDGWGLCDFIVANEHRLDLYFPKTKEANLTPDLSKAFAKTKSKEYENREEFLYTIKPEGAKKLLDWSTSKNWIGRYSKENLPTVLITITKAKELRLKSLMDCQNTLSGF